MGMDCCLGKSVCEIKATYPHSRSPTHPQFSVRNAEINKTDYFSIDRIFLKSNYRLLEIFHFTYFVLLSTS
jgi:hypothetical protein